MFGIWRAGEVTHDKVWAKGFEQAHVFRQLIRINAVHTKAVHTCINMQGGEGRMFGAVGFVCPHTGLRYRIDDGLEAKFKEER